MEQNQHILTVTERKKLSVSGVLEVDFITPEKIRAKLKSGEQFLIVGDKLKMGAFSNQTGVLFVEGKISEIKYTPEKINFVKKILK